MKLQQRSRSGSHILASTWRLSARALAEDGEVRLWTGRGDVQRHDQGYKKQQGASVRLTLATNAATSSCAQPVSSTDA